MLQLLPDHTKRPELRRERSELTDRERDVLVLIVHGLSNAEIAAGFVVGDATVTTHVNRVFQKPVFAIASRVRTMEAGGFGTTPDVNDRPR